MKVTILRETAVKVAVTVRKLDKIIFQQSGNPNSHAYQTRVLQLTGLELHEFISALPVEPGNTVDLVAGEEETAGKPFHIEIRNIAAKAEFGVERFTSNDPEELVKNLLIETDPPRTEPVLTWHGTDRLAVLDIDYHAIPMASRPSVSQLETYARKVSPVPVAWHTSHGRGLKLYYVAVPGYTAAELAAVAAVCYRNIDGRATYEIKRESRHPGYARGTETCGQVHTGTGTADLSAVGRWLGRGIAREDVDAYLSERGWEYEKHYPHDQCPLHPEISTHGKPVLIGQDGIFCHKCAGDGYSSAPRRRPGWIPYSTLVHGADSRLSTMVRGFVHWSHARLVLEHTLGGFKEDILKLAYTAALKLVHGDDDIRIPEVFTASDLVLVGNSWLASETRIALRENVGRDQVSSLPSCHEIVVQGSMRKVKTNTQKLSELRHPGTEKTKFGYYSLTPIRGCRIWGEYLPYPDERIPFLIPNVDIRENRRPKYLPKARRLDGEEAWKRIERCCPKLSRNYITLLIVAKGYCEGGMISTPFFSVAGPTGAGKTGHVDLAAGICGDAADTVQWRRNRERFGQAIHESASKGDFIRIDEIFKTSADEKVTPREALDPLLTLTPKSLNHVLYTGPQAIGRIFPVVLTDINLPIEVQQDEQLARRIWYVRLHSEVDWKPSAEAHGITQLYHIRNASQDLADACDSILSDIIDTYFQQPSRFDDVAKALGYELLRESSDYLSPKDDFLAFARAVCDAPNPEGSDAARYPGHMGWKAIHRDDDTLLSQLWNDFADNLLDKWTESRRLTAHSWNKTFQISEEVALDISHYRGNTVYIRFRVGPMRKPIAINGEIFKLTKQAKPQELTNGDEIGAKPVLIAG